MVIKLLKNTHTIKARDREILLRQGLLYAQANGMVAPF